MRSLGLALINLIHPRIQSFLAGEGGGELLKGGGGGWVPFNDRDDCSKDVILMIAEMLGDDTLLLDINLYSLFVEHLQQYLPPLSGVQRLAMMLSVLTTIDSSSPPVIKQCLGLFQMEMTHILNSDDQKGRSDLLTDMANVFETTLISVEGVYRSKFKALLGKLEPFQPHLMARHRHRLLVIALHPDTMMCMHELQQLCFPKPYLLTKTLKTTTISSDELVEIYNRLPLTIPPSTPFINDWDNAVWRFNLHFEPFHSKDVVIAATHTTKDLLFQIIIFSLPNWKQLWVEADLPCSFELTHRLHRLKHTNWAPRADQFIRTMLRY
jgi:hypothetical protein